MEASRARDMPRTGLTWHQGLAADDRYLPGLADGSWEENNVRAEHRGFCKLRRC